MESTSGASAAGVTFGAALYTGQGSVAVGSWGSASGTSTTSNEMFGVDRSLAR